MISSDEWDLQPPQTLLEERYRLLTEGFLRPLQPSESARLAELEASLAEQDRRDADRLDALTAGGAADRLDASLDRLEEYVKTLCHHSVR